MTDSLQKQLTRSHFLVTLASVLLLTLLALVGYYIYLQTPYPARWAGEEALFDADELAYLVDYWDEPLDQTLAQDYLTEITDVVIYGELVGAVDESTAPLDQAERIAAEREALTMIVLDSTGHILATDAPSAYPVGQQIVEVAPPGFHANWLNAQSINTAVPHESIQYNQSDGFHIGFAPIIDSNSKLIGWVYYRAYDQPVGEILTQTAVQAGWILLGALLIATVVAGLIGRRVAQHFSVRLEKVSAAAAAVATGNLDQRVPADGDDEIGQLGTQFNQMATQISSQVRALHDLADTNAQLAQEAGSLATLEERNRLARDLHDAIKQKLFGLNLTAGALKSLVEKDPPKATDLLDKLSQLTTEIIEEMDQIIHQLRPAALEDQGLESALTQLFQTWQEQSGISVNFVSSGRRELPLGTEHTLYRITQEALTNILKHANAQTVGIALTYGIDEVELTIRDNGNGFDVSLPRAATSLGLESMKGRVRELGGTIRINSEPTIGTTLKIEIPSGALM